MEQWRNRMNVYNDAAQICLNGHIVNDSVITCPADNKKFCQICGEKTVINCPSCSSAIQGAQRTGPRPPFSKINLQKPPSYCHNCGKPYPWTDRNIQAAIELFIESGKLDEKELEQTKQDIRNISRDIPQAEPSAMRIKKRLKLCGIVAYNVMMEFATKTAAAVLKQP